MVSAGHEFDLNQLLRDFLGCVEQFNARESGFVHDLIFQFTLVITKFRPLAGFSYIPKPANIAKKKTVINVKMAMITASNGPCCRRCIHPRLTTSGACPAASITRKLSILRVFPSLSCCVTFPNSKPKTRKLESMLFCSFPKTKAIPSITVHPTVNAHITPIFFCSITQTRSITFGSKIFPAFLAIALTVNMLVSCATAA